MSIHEETIAKLSQLPESLVEEVSDFISFLLLKQDRERWQLWNQFAESIEIAESSISDYLPNLEEYEEQLAREEIKW